MKSYSESRVSHMGCSKSLINLRSKYEESSDLKQFSQTYPLLPETEFNDKPLTESWFLWSVGHLWCDITGHNIWLLHCLLISDHSLAVVVIVEYKRNEHYL